jgi:two-component system, cell cycle response regulator
MPKKRSSNRKGAATLRVPSIPGGHGEVARVGSLLVVHGADVDIGRHVLCDRPITIGREDDNELALFDGSISRRHCRITRDDTTGVYVVADLGSTNGTVVNHDKLDKPAPLTEGDKIFIGSSVVKFSWADGVDLQYQSRVQDMVSTDALTGLASRRSYDAALTAMAARAEAEDSDLSLLVIDLDGVKQINDTHGHQMGGHVIAEAARTIGQVLGGHGLLCRWGGDEFVACLPGADGAQARRLAEEVRRRVAAACFVKDGIDLRVTVSIGVASWPNDVARPGELFTAADRSMYRAKRSGRNQVVAADDDQGGDEGGEQGTGQSTLS